MSKGVKLLAALMEDDVGGGNDLMRAARTLAGAVSDLLKAVEPASGEVSQGTSNPVIITKYLVKAVSPFFLFLDLASDISLLIPFLCLSTEYLKC